MPITFDWYLKDYIVLVVIHGQVTKSDLEEYFIALTSVLDTATQPTVHVLADARQLTEGFSAMSMSEIKGFAAMMNHPRFGWSLVVSQDRVANFFAGTVMKLSGNQFKIHQKPESVLEMTLKLVPEASHVLTVDHFNATVNQILSEQGSTTGHS